MSAPEPFRLISERAHWQRVFLWRWATAILLILAIAASSWGGWASMRVVHATDQAAETAQRLGVCVEALEATTRTLIEILH